MDIVVVVAVATVVAVVPLLLFVMFGVPLDEASIFIVSFAGVCDCLIVGRPKIVNDN